MLVLPALTLATGSGNVPGRAGESGSIAHQHLYVNWDPSFASCLPPSALHLDASTSQPVLAGPFFLLGDRSP